MQIYYRDQPGFGYRYVALRAPNDAWNGFYDDAIGPLVAELIRQFVLFGDVDPSRVHLIGYSHGGYGAFVIGTKISDRFATVHSSAAAATDGETRLANLRNTRFTWMVGEKDTAYGRAERARRSEAEWNELRAADPDGYRGGFEFQAGYGHGGLPDRDKLAVQMPHVRVDAPKRVVWLLTDDRLTEQFWVSVDAPAEGGEVRLEIRAAEGDAEQTLAGTCSGVGRVVAWLDQRHVDVSRPLRIAVGEAEPRTVALEPSASALCASVLQRGDPRLAGSCRIVVDPGR